MRVVKKAREAALMFSFIEENSWGGKGECSLSCCWTRTVAEVGV